ncbi:hypothetical protein ABZ467_31785 [Streptomyces sp. NPDC005727]|uniref:hypothetical protein n=1 Tax=Streptomyces sp. NPDC005727 TaxID=3157053 RepID=UPI0033EB6CAA
MPVRSRRTLLTAVTVTAGLTLAAVTPALAGTGASHARPAAVSAAQGDPRNATQRVADFYGAYIDSVWAADDPAAAANAKALRAFYLSAAAQKKAGAYEKKNHADGVLFAQNVPVRWKVDYTGSGMGHSTSRVTLTWSDGGDAQVTRIDVQSDLRTLKITALKPAD